MLTTQISYRFLPFRINIWFLLFIVLLQPLHSDRTYGQELILCDNTPQGTVISKEILPRTYSNPVTLSLLQTKASKYFTLDKRTGQLASSRDIDRDQMCAESGLCCLPQTNSALGSTRFIHFHHHCATCSPSVLPYESMTDVQVWCTFNLSVSLVSTPGQQPDVYEVVVYICEENDHAPEFKLISADTQPREHISWQPPIRFSTTFPQSPLYIVNVSESVSVGHHIPLPLAEDIDAPPFHVQRYEITHFSASSIIPLENPFQLNVIWNDADRNIDRIQTNPSDSRWSDILRLELIVKDVLDRERIPQYTFQLLAIDGGKPEKTGTLDVMVRILDANDHPPQFDQPVYEAEVDERVSEQKVVSIRAVDEDEGLNAIIRYDWPEGSNWVERIENRNPIDSSGTESNRDRMRSLPPGYWFRLDRETGDVFVRHPLDYETQTTHQFKVLAYNPISQTAHGSDHSIETHLSMTAAATVNVKVRNLDDEPPRIVVDYSNGYGVNYIEIKENGIDKYFVAFIRVTDPDFSQDDSLKISSTGMQPIRRLNHFGGTARITCELASDRDYYILEEKQNNGRGSLEEIRYALSTRHSLDRERSTEDHIRIVCQDSGSPPKNATATAVVRIIDENDCVPEVEVYSVDGSSASIARGLPLNPWLTHKLRRWIKSHRNSPLLTYSPILPAYMAKIPIYTVHVAENQPAGMVFARLLAKDKDADENGRVTFEIAKTSVSVNVSATHDLQSSLNDKIDINEIMAHYPTDGTVALTSNSDVFTYFQLDYITGDLKTKRVIDREEEHMLIDQLFMVIQASDHGIIPKSTVLVLHVIIDDENDNPPVFSNPMMEFIVKENVSAPSLVGEIFVNDPDIHRPSMLTGVNDDAGEHKMRLTRLRLRIDHDHRDLPFSLSQTSTSGRFELKTTRVLDRESEEAYQFRIIATDLGPTQYRSDRGSTLLNRRDHSATASVLVTVQDVNDNTPEIIFPKPSNLNSTVHRVSYHDRAGCEIVNVNAKDQDASEANHRVHFELNPQANDIFTIDANSGVLKTRRRMTKADIGEYALHITVADGGNPPLKTQLLLRLSVVSSEPHWKCATVEPGRLNILGQPPYGHPEPDVDWKFDNKERISGSYNPGPTDGNQPFSQTRLLQTDVMLSVFAVLIFLLLLIMVALCLCLRHQRNVFAFLPDICAICFRCFTSGSNREADDNRQKYYAKNFNQTNKPDHISDRYNDQSDTALMTNLLKNATGHFKESGMNAEATITGQHHRHGSFGSVSHVSPNGSFLSPAPHNQPLFHSSFNVNNSYSGYASREQGQKDVLMNSHCGLPYSTTMMIGPDQMFNPIMQNFRPGTTLAVNIPDVADQAETRHKQPYASGYGPPMPRCMDTAQSPNSSCSRPGNFPSHVHHMYNVGHMRLGSNSLTPATPETVYIADTRHDGLISPHLLFNDRASEVAFRPIQDDLHLYQRIHPIEDYSSKNQLQYPAPIKSPQCFNRPFITDEDIQNYVTTKSRSNTAHDQGLVEWRSDPSLNHFTSELGQVDTLTYYEKAAECELAKYANTMKASSTRLKRFNSGKQAKRSESRTINAPYYSTLHQSTQSSDPFKSKLSSSIAESKLTTSTDKATGDNYAVTFPQIQSSFV